MMKKLAVLTAIIFLFGAALAYEQPLADFGFTGITNTTNSTMSCKELTINLPTSALAEKGVAILSINSEFLGDTNDSTYVSIEVNGGEKKKYWRESFACKTQCWARVFVPEISEQTAKVNICAALGGASQGINVLEDSFIGIYDTPLLSIKNSAPSEIRLGERAKMNITVTNAGTKTAPIFVQFIHPDTRAKVAITSFDIVEGDSSATTAIAPGETKQFVYYIKPSMVSSYNLPSAALFFKNIFGEEETLFSNHPSMNVIEQKPLDVALVSTNEKDPRMFKVIIKNNYDSQMTGSITMSPQTAFDEYTQNFSIQPNSDKEINFVAKTLAGGDYSFFAVARDENNIYYSNQIDVSVTQSGLSLQIILAIAGILIGAIIFCWIYFASEKQSKR